MTKSDVSYKTNRLIPDTNRCLLKIFLVLSFYGCYQFVFVSYEETQRSVTENDIKTESAVAELLALLVAVAVLEPEFAGADRVFHHTQRVYSYIMATISTSFAWKIREVQQLTGRPSGRRLFVLAVPQLLLELPCARIPERDLHTPVA